MQELRWEQSFGNMKVELSRKLVDSQMKIFQIDMITGNMKEKKKGDAKELHLWKLSFEEQNEP